ncbi:LacI family DNA-binding transcriptional regulator, partial [Xenorhabdus sp. Flor]|uniref:LacI family DNA-binding transcriptional regulator n=1 Tax=Xenorhabdus cabanillasii TaxID=351673 RepID=UPI0019A69611
MVTMLDVAKKVGVSKATVSRVLNGKDIVSEDIKKRVLAAIEEIGYRPNLLAQQLAMKKNNLMGFVMTNSLYDGPYFSAMAYKVASFSEKYGHQLILADGKHSAEYERKAINFLLDLKCSGILVYPQYLSTSELENIIDENQTPIIIINRYLPNKPDKFISVDHVQSSELLIDYVLSQGHKEIAFIQGEKGSISGHYRLQSYKNRLTMSGININEQLIVSGNWSLGSGYQATKELLSRKVKFTALIASNDDMAIGAIKALKESGLQIPNDISIAGFDNSTMCEYISPQLTSVSFPFDNILEQAIIKIIEPDFCFEKNKIKGQLIIRESVSSVTVANRNIAYGF